VSDQAIEDVAASARLLVGADGSVRPAAGRV